MPRHLSPKYNVRSLNITPHVVFQRESQYNKIVVESEILYSESRQFILVIPYLGVIYK